MTKTELETYITIHVSGTISKSADTDRIVCGSVNKEVELDGRQSNSGRKDLQKLKYKTNSEGERH